MQCTRAASGHYGYFADAFPVWGVGPTGQPMDYDVAFPKMTSVRTTRGELCSVHQVQACHQWMPPDPSASCWMPLNNYALWSDQHPSRQDLANYGPRGALDPREAATVSRRNARVSGPQWAIDAWVVAHLALDRQGRRLMIPEDTILPSADFLIDTATEDTATANPSMLADASREPDPWRQGAGDPWTAWTSTSHSAEVTASEGTRRS